MLKEVDNSKITIECNQCKNIYEEDITGKTIQFIDEFKEYENFSSICPNCSSIELFNMNLPPESEDFPLDQMPQDEQINRTNVRKLKEILLGNH
ncbi:hypothetical protein [Bacillus smithii]|uniref:hypothetical protein n=1 Tax=Bacillus smithii TaxID=1479 RepID=UPI003D1B0AEE